MPFVAKAKTMERDIEEKVRYNEAHAHFTYDVPALKFTEFIQTNRLRMEVIFFSKIRLLFLLISISCRFVVFERSMTKTELNPVFSEANLMMSI